MNDEGAKVGDWIRFYKDGRFVIGQVEYIGSNFDGSAIYMTDHGSTGSYAEVRRKP